MSYLMPLFGFIVVVAIVLVVAAFVRSMIPEFLQPFFTGVIMFICLLITLDMGISAVFTALKGALDIAFDFNGIEYVLQYYSNNVPK